LDYPKPGPFNRFSGYVAYWRGRILTLRKKHEQALSCYQQALKQHPRLAQAYYARGRCYSELQKFEPALADYNQALRLKPKYFSTSTTLGFFFYRGRAHYWLKNYRNALIDFDRALMLKPGTAGNYSMRAHAEYALKEYQQAIDDCTRAAEANYKSVCVYNIRATANYHLKNYQKAIPDFDAALELNAKGVASYVNRGLCYYGLKNYSQAIQDISRAITLTPDAETARNSIYNLGLIYLDMGEIAQARVELDRALELSSSKSYLPADWLITWLEIGWQQHEPAIINRLLAMADREPEHYLSLVARAVALGLKGKWDMARLELERAIKQDEEQWDAHFWLGMARTYLGEPGAAEAVEKALELDIPPVLLAPLRWLKQDRPDDSAWVDKFLARRRAEG
jgi:tetratricopeptide (TPR) repeat protein